MQICCTTDVENIEDTLERREEERKNILPEEPKGKHCLSPNDEGGLQKHLIQTPT